MPISKSDDSVILDSGIRLKFLRDAEYDAAPPLVALDGEDQTLLQCTSDGKLKVDASVSIDAIDIGDVNLKLKTIGEYGDQYQYGVLNPDTVTWAQYVQDQRMSFVGGALSVTLATPITENDFNKYGYNDTVSPSTPTNIVTRNLAVGEVLAITGVTVWADIDAEWMIEVGGIQKGGLRTSPSNLTGRVSYTNPIVAIGPKTVVVRAIHYGSATEKMQANLEGDLS